MKILRVGDPHAKVGCLDEMRAFFLFIAEQAKLHQVDRIEILGDLFHTHNVIRLEVLEFWVWALDLLSQICETVVLVGNHDQSGDYKSEFSSLSVFALMNKKNLIIVERPTLLGAYGYIPYTHDADSFIRSAGLLADSGAKVLVCHQTIQGSKYESGIYAPDGIPAEQWAHRFSHVISGHIHSEQSFGNILYPGTGRWDSVSDANQRKGIWLYTHSSGSGEIGKRSVSGDAVGRSERDDIASSTGTGSDGTIQAARFISTDGVCSPIRCFEWREGSEAPEWNDNERVSVELIGSSVWVTSQKEKLKGKCSIKTTITDTRKGTIRKTGDSFEHFMKELFPTTMNRENLLKYAKEIGIV